MSEDSKRTMRVIIPAIDCEIPYDEKVYDLVIRLARELPDCPVEIQTFVDGVKRFVDRREKAKE